MKKIAPTQQLLKLLSKEEQNVLAGIMAHLSEGAEELTAMALVAYLRFGMCPHLETAFIQGIVQNFICYLETTREGDKLHISYALNPVMLVDLHENHPEDYKAVIAVDDVVTKKEAEKFFKKFEQ